MSNAFITQGMSGINHIFQFRQRFPRPDLEFMTVGFHQPRCGFQTGHQRLTAAVKNNARAQLAQTAHPGGKPRRIHTFRQTAADDYHIELPEPGQRIGHKLLPFAFGDTETGEIQIRHRAAVFGQFHVDPRASRDHMKTVCQPVFTEKMLEFFLIIFPQKAADSYIHPEISQDFGDINAFSRRM